MASPVRDQPAGPSAATRNGRWRGGWSVGGAGVDPAHGGPLPDATFPELIGRLINDVSDLADRQIELAKQEIGEARDEAIGAAIKIAIGAGIVMAAGPAADHLALDRVHLVLQLAGRVHQSIGPVTLAWLGWLRRRRWCRCWPVFIAYRRFITGRGSSQATDIWPPLPRTQDTLKEDLEWVRRLRTRSVR